MGMASHWYCAVPTQYATPVTASSVSWNGSHVMLYTVTSREKSKSMTRSTDTNAESNRQSYVGFEAVALEVRLAFTVMLGRYVGKVTLSVALYSGTHTTTSSVELSAPRVMVAFASSAGSVAFHAHSVQFWGMDKPPMVSGVTGGRGRNTSGESALGGGGEC